MDLLDFTADEMYFERPLPPAAAALIHEASEHYGDDADAAERCLQRAEALAPDDLTVLVALYRFYFYQRRYPETLAVADHCITIAARELGIQEDWHLLDHASFGHAVQQSMTLTRFLLLAMKGAGYVLLRMNRPAEALARLECIAAFDEHDRLGLADLLSWARDAAFRAEVQAKGDNITFIH
ncbi:MAG: hypothetical protein LJE69_16315 [Thiohalocapsa sp.]|jgi:tetratricopeptide (TPR) repeat protein|uniref:hypothetical protein n=1 Tax=Thiohalocapsa sp. TaxID=2497641 RepID=UPI0025DAFC85|nr:hypothetical protein [Thiohalocapsa sp.]MCG6942802.1 hypothetical protein [Thiohalocapsa sp.]